jgi:hypothetical protein
MVRRNNYSGHKVIAATNADFWRNNIPIGIQISNHQFVKSEGDNSRIYFDNHNKPFIEKTSFSGTLIVDGITVSINGINHSRDTNNLIIYNKFKGPATETSRYGTEVVLSPLENWTVNDTMDFKVEDVFAGKGNAVIPAGKIILSGSGVSEKFIERNLKSGGVIKILLQAGMHSNISIKELTGGYPRLVDKGINIVPQSIKEEGSPSGLTRNPRTAAGFSKDSTKLYLITVDGRQASSAGMTVMELADFIVQAGIYCGINLDGGGSTTMVVRDSVVNSPSDKTGERKVCNSLQIISSDPGGTLKKIELNPKSVRLFHGAALQYYLTGKDEYGNPIQLDASKITYRLSSKSGHITSTGFFSTGDEADTAYISAEYNGLKDSAKAVTKITTAITLSPQNIILDTTKTASFSVYERDMDSLFYLDENRKYEWKTSDEKIGLIDEQGCFKGKSEGAVKVIASGGKFSDTACVNIRVMEGSKSVKPFNNLDSLKTAKTNVDSVNLFIEKKNGADMLGVYYEYTVDTLKSNSITISLNAALPGTPDLISMPLQAPSLMDGSEISMVISDDNNEMFQLNGVFSNGVGIFSFKDKIAKQNNSAFFYPAAIRQIIIKFGKNKNHDGKAAGRYYLGGISAVYKQN